MREGLALALALLLGCLATTLFYRHPLGLSVPLFVVALLGSLAALMRAAGLCLRLRSLVLVPPLLFFAAMVAVRANGLLTLLNLLTTVALLALLTAFFGHGRLEALMLPGYPLALLDTLARIVERPAPAILTTARTTRPDRHLHLLRRILVGALVAAPILVLFATLLARADAVFDRYLHDATRLDLADLLPEAALTWAAAWLAAGFLLTSLSRKPPHALPGTLAPPTRLGAVEAATVLALVDLLFLLFAWIQAVYVFSGQALATMDYEAYRLYARRGFFELLVVAVLTMALILALRWWAAPIPGPVRWLATLMVLLALVLLVSAFARLVEWERVEFYVETGPRILVRWFMVWLAVAFGWLLVSLWWLPDRFAIGAFAAWLGLLASLNLANPDDDVARYNLARRDDLSTRYIHQLSDDAVPALAAGLDLGLDPALERRIADDLAGRLVRLEYVEAREPWTSRHLARRTALATLRDLRATGRLP